jgi:precorrin-6B methylase 2
MPSTAPLRSTRQIAAAFVLALVCAGFEENGFEVFIPYVPTPQAIVERMLELAEVGERDYLIDLGSGDGRIPITAARKHGARALGVEIKPELVRLADRHAADAGVTDKVSFREQDLFKTPISEATVIALYLPPSINLKLRPRLLNELRPGSRVVSQSYNMGGWHADARAEVRGINVYLWIVPARVAGRWILHDGSREITLAISQEFQEIKGGATVGARSLPLLDADLRGDRIEFALDLGDAQPTRFRGRVAGDVMEQDETNATSLWRATRDTGVKSR